MKGRWITVEVRDAVIDFIAHWSGCTDISCKQFLEWMNLSGKKYQDWKKRYGQKNRHNAPIPRYFWLLSWEREAIVRFAQSQPLNGYRRLSYMMLVLLCQIIRQLVMLAGKRAASAMDGNKNSSLGPGFRQSLPEWRSLKKGIMESDKVELMRLCKKLYLSVIFNVCSGTATTHLSRKSLLSSTMVLMKHISLLSHGQKLPIRFGQPHLKLNHYGLKVHRLFKTTESRYRCKALHWKCIVLN